MKNKPDASANRCAFIMQGDKGRDCRSGEFLMKFLSIEFALRTSNYERM